MDNQPNNDIVGNMDNQPNDNNVGNMDDLHDNNNENAEDGDAGVEAGIEGNQEIEEDLLPRRSQKRKREEDEDEVEERSHKRFRRCDDSASTSNSDNDSIKCHGSTSQDTAAYSPVRLAGTSAIDAGVLQRKEGDSPLPKGSRKRSREEDEEDIEERSCESFRFWEDSASTCDSDSDSGKSQSSYSQDTTSYSPVRVAGTSAVDVGVIPGKESDSPLPKGSRKRSREEDEEDTEERSSKRSRLWDDFAGTSDSDTSGNSPVGQVGILPGKEDDPLPRGSRSPVRHACASAAVAEEDPLPSRPMKRLRKTNKVVDERSSSPKSEQGYEIAGSNSGTVTASTSSISGTSEHSSNLAEDAGAVKETEEKGSQQVEKENPRPSPGGSRERPKEDEEDEEDGGHKRGKKRLRR